MEKPKAFAENLGKWRAHEGLSLRQAAARLGVSHAHVLKYERGTVPRVDDAMRIAEVLGVPLDALMREGGFDEYAIDDTD